MLKPEIERLAILETKLDSVCDDITELKDALNAFVKSADARYASKVTETLVYGLTGAVLLAVLGAVMGLILIGA